MKKFVLRSCCRFESVLSNTGLRFQFCCNTKRNWFNFGQYGSKRLGDSNCRHFRFGQSGLQAREDAASFVGK